MPITINNVTINNRLTIINDADVSQTNPNNGPKLYSGDTETDVIIDGKGYLNLSGVDVVPDNIHALQFYPATDSGWLEFDGTADNQSITSSTIPSWANTMITRWNGEKTYDETYQTTYDNLLANLDSTSETYSQDVANAQTSAQTAATTAKNNILGA
jgi:hypothetical protein|tara:strand:+ start:276 stop:746 length:471 start_codon:yes stop_codon:yes gene_type:complete